MAFRSTHEGRQTHPNVRPRRRVATAAAAAFFCLVGAGCTRDQVGQAVGAQPAPTDRNANTDVVKYVYAQNGQSLKTVSCGPNGVIKSVGDTEHETPTSLEYASVTNPGHCMDDTITIPQVHNRQGRTKLVNMVIAYAPNTGFVLHPDIVVGSKMNENHDSVAIIASEPFAPSEIDQLRGDFSSRRSNANFLQEVMDQTHIVTDRKPDWLVTRMDSFFILRGSQVQLQDIGDPTGYFQANVADAFRQPNLASSPLDGGVVLVNDSSLLDPKDEQLVILYQRS